MEQEEFGFCIWDELSFEEKIFDAEMNGDWRDVQNVLKAKRENDGK